MATVDMLAGIRVVDLTTVMFGPYCTATLAGMGADVVKLEPEEGDELRRVGRPRVTRRMGPVHLTMNRGKRSVTWDARSRRGQALLRRLIARSDVLIHNLRTEAAVRAGLDYAAVQALRPDIIHVHCTGFGSDGPYAGKPAYDDIIQALSGSADLLPRVLGDDRPRFLPSALADKVSGLHAVQAVLGGLYHRQRTGQGQAIEVPMFEVYTHFLLQEHLYDRVFTAPPGTAGYPRQLDPDRQPMATADGHIVVAPYTDARWLRFFALAGREDVLADERLATPLLRIRHLGMMQRAMADIVRCDTTARWLDRLAAADIPACRVNRLDDLVDDPHLAAVGLFEPLVHPSEGECIGMRPPIRFGAGKPIALRHAPGLGEHNAELAAELGLGAAEDE